MAEEWAGYESSDAAGRYARADAPASAPPPGIHTELSHLFAMLLSPTGRSVVE